MLREMRAEIRNLKKKNQQLVHELDALKQAKSQEIRVAKNEAQKEVLERLLKWTQPSQNE
jgi:vacuolar-type H+-ATPase subunit H